MLKVSLFPLILAGSILSFETLSIGAPAASDAPKFSLSETGQVIRFNFRLSTGAAATRIAIDTMGATGLEKTYSVQVTPDKEGLAIRVRGSSWDAAAEKWATMSDDTITFWQKEGSRAESALKEIEDRSWVDQLIPGLVRHDGDTVRVWLADRLVFTGAFPKGRTSEVRFDAGAGTKAEFSESKTGDSSRYELAQFVSLLGGGAIKPKRIEADGIPFEVWGDELLSLRNASWVEWKDDPGRFNSVYDSGPVFNGDLRTPWLQVPRADYTAAYVLAYAEDDAETTNRFTLRAGRRIGGASSKSQVYQVDFAGEAPRSKKGKLQVIRVPFSEAFAQNVEGDLIDIEVTKEVRLSRRSPDPNRYQWRPLGLPSGVKIAAITLERSPIQMQVKAVHNGNLFEVKEPPRFTVSLQNVADKPQEYRVVFASGKVEKAVTGTLPAGESKEESVEFPVFSTGVYPLAATLKTKGGDSRFTYNTTFAVIPAIARDYREESSLGTFVQGGGHFTPPDKAKQAELLRKLGFRYATSRSMPSAVRDANGLIQGQELSMRPKRGDDFVKEWDERKAEHPDLPDRLMIFHEDAFSGPQATRTPSLFSGREYVLNDEEKKRFDELFAFATRVAKKVREAQPHVKISLGNGPMPIREAFYQAGFPTELFDSGGNENPTFGRPPESQPPDCIGNNSSLWMDRQLLDFYGYKDKPVTQCHETIYPSTNPGNLSLQTQADYLVRHTLHSLAWGMPLIRGGALTDMGASYKYSNWGQIGLFTSRPEVAPKPAAVSMAALTFALDGAKYQDFIDTGSESAYLMRFMKKDGTSLHPFWVVRGERPYRIEIEGANEVSLISATGEKSAVSVKAGAVEVLAKPQTAYLQLPAGASIKSVSLGTPIYGDDAPKGKVSKLASLGSLEGWSLAEGSSPILEYYNPISPRRKGDFAIEPVASFEGNLPALKVTPRPLKTGKETMPMVAELVSKGIALAGKPTEVGLWVNGNSSYGRIIFELEDASGQRWTSIGAKAKSGSQWMADWIGKDAADNFVPGEVSDWNTDDVFGLSRINFDGWRYLGFPLPGQYPGEGYHWPANSQWRSDKDGVVHYPLTLKKIIVELPEKTLHLTRYAPTKRSEIYLRNLIAVEGAVDAPKLTPNEYVDSVQVKIQ